MAITSADSYREKFCNIFTALCHRTRRGNAGKEGLARLALEQDIARPFVATPNWATSLGRCKRCVEPASVRKKMKDKAFARPVNRDDIVRGAEELGVDLDAHMAEVIEAMRPVAGELGLGG